jgi:hypothetical protein
VRTRLGVVLIALLLIGCGESPAPSPDVPTPGPLPLVALNGPRDGVKQAILTEGLIPHTGPTPEGPELRDPFGENVQPVEAGRIVVVLTDPIPGPNGTWVRTWIPENPSATPGDFFAWLPATKHGRPLLRDVAAATCPRFATIASIAPLLPPDRLRCVGDRVFAMDVRTWLPASYASYDVDPAWYGLENDMRRSVALFDGGVDPFAKDAPRLAEAAGSWIDARVPPTVELPPAGMLVRVTGRFGDPTANTCSRRPNPDVAAAGPPGSGLPAEAKADSVEWCREQFVVSGWQVLLGPEGRPIERDAPQLLRGWDFNQPPGVQVACGGVGMAQLTFRIDADRVDPVWIDVAGGGTSLARFGRGLRLSLGPMPAVVGDKGVRLVDREILDPDRGKPGLAICPEGDVIDFGLLP